MRAPDTLFGYLRDTAQAHPTLPAVIWPAAKGEASVSYAELYERSAAWAAGLHAMGVQAGTRVALFVRPSPELIGLVYALFRLGAVPVLIDPGMGRSALVRCVAQMRPEVWIGVPLSLCLRWLHPHALASVRLYICVGSQYFPGAHSLAALERAGRGELQLPHPEPQAAAAILFTSGSTGPAKGVQYTHANFTAQVHALRALYSLGPGQVDLACFPLFALFNAAFQRTSIFPRINTSRPATVDPAEITRLLARYAISDSFGSPAIWKRVVPYARSNGLRFPALRRAMIAGASVPPSLVAEFRALLDPQGDVHTPYGATEALPIASISGREILEQRQRIEGGHGICVGRLAPGVEMACIALHDQAIESWDPSLALAPGQQGEWCVRGAVVTREYAEQPTANRFAKIHSALGPWHRMGDAGYCDAQGLWWFTGRKSQRVQSSTGTYLPEALERVVETMPKLHKCAVVGAGPAGQERVVLVVEGQPASESAILEHARKQARADAPQRLPQPERVLFHPRLPVDVRHNAKIRRELLKSWAEERLR